MPKTVLVAGAAGLVGQNLVPLLLGEGHAVTALDKNGENLELLARLNPGVDARRADLAEEGPWIERFAGAEAVVDLKAQITAARPEPFQRNNVQAQRWLLEACRRHGTPHLVHLSSSVVISVASDAYTESKRQAEQMVVRSGVPHTILRPPLLFGCFDAKHLGYIARLLERAPVLPVPGSGRYLRQPLYVLDLCRVILRCLDRPPTGSVHNIIGHERIDFIDLLRGIARAKGLRRLILPVPVPVFSAALKLHARLADRPAFTTEQLEALTAGDDFPVENWTEEFGVPYTAFREALKQMYASPGYARGREMVSPH
jgi:nucleoside-diphosphate-sugar epimerase